LIAAGTTAAATCHASALAPVAFTQPAGPIRATTATLAGMAVAQGSPTTAWFEWGTDATYGQTTDPVSVGQGKQVVRVTAPLTNLMTGGVYFFRLVGSNAVGIARGQEQRFTTGMRLQIWGCFVDGLPATPAGMTNIAALGCGHTHALAIRNDGTVAAWVVGTRPWDQYGQGNVPPGLSNVVAVAGGYSHCLALKEDGTVVAWGTYASYAPAYVPNGLSNVVALAGGDFHSVALKADGTVAAWGFAPYGETNMPYGLSNVVAIACGSSHTLALSASGQITAWGGGNDPGGSPPSAPFPYSPFVAIASGGWYNLARCSNGLVRASGRMSTSVPMPTNLTNVVAMGTGGYNYGEVLREDGTLAGWGDAAAVAAIPPGLSNVVTFVGGGDYHCVGLAPMNLAPTAYPVPATGTADQDLVITLTGFDPNGDSLSAQVESLPTQGRLYQYTPGGRGALVTNAPAVLTDPLRVIFAPHPGTFGSAYASFDFSVSDGEFSSGLAACSVAIQPPPRPVLQPPAVSGDAASGFLLSFTGLSNCTYSVLYSPDLNSWSLLGTASQVSPGQFWFTDFSSNTLPLGFYRIRYP